MTSRVPRIFLKTNVEKYACMKKCEQGIRSEALSAGGSFREELKRPGSSPVMSIFFINGIRVVLRRVRCGVCSTSVSVHPSIWSRARRISAISICGIVCRNGIVTAAILPEANSGIMSLIGLPRNFSSCRGVGVSETGSIVPEGLSDREDFSCVWRGRRRGNVSAVCEMYARSTNAASDATVFKCRYVGML